MKKHVSKSPTLVRVNAAALRALRAQGEEWCVSDLWLPGAPAMVHLEALNSLIIAYGGWVSAKRRDAAWSSHCEARARVATARDNRWTVARRLKANKAKERKRLDTLRAYAATYGERLRFPWELERQAWEVFCAAIEACTPVAMAA